MTGNSDTIKVGDTVTGKTLNNHGTITGVVFKIVGGNGPAVICWVHHGPDGSRQVALKECIKTFTSTGDMETDEDAYHARVLMLRQLKAAVSCLTDAGSYARLLSDVDDLPDIIGELAVPVRLLIEGVEKGKL